MRLFLRVVADRDCTILEGHRTPERQAQLFRQGRSTVRRSNHNEHPALAVDVAPYPIDWPDEARFVDFARHVLDTADELGIAIRWGGDWDGVWDRKGPRPQAQDPRKPLDDLVHYELVLDEVLRAA